MQIIPTWMKEKLDPGRKGVGQIDALLIQNIELKKMTNDKFIN
jgi:hypothetical protein